MGITAAERDRARDTLARLACRVGGLSLLGLLVVAVVFPSIPPAYRYLPLVASVLVLGLPHGAVDYVALPRVLAGRVDLRGVGIVAVLYLVLGAVYLGLWFLAPLPAAVLFILLTWFHWGQGDLYALRSLFGVGHVDDRIQAVLTVCLRGGLPMLVPLVGFPDRYRTVVATFVEPFGGTVDSWWLFQPGPRFALGAAFLAFTALVLARGRRRGRSHGRDADRRGWLVDTTEVGLLWVYFLVVPPVLAVGVYFCLWHSLRHIARVVLLDDRAVGALADRHFLPAVGRFALEAALPTGLALAFLGWLWVTVPVSVETIAGGTGLYLVAIAVLTLPHTVVVTWLDRRQGVWSPGTEQCG